MRRWVIIGLIMGAFLAGGWQLYARVPGAVLMHIIGRNLDSNGDPVIADVTSAGKLKVTCENCESGSVVIPEDCSGTFAELPASPSTGDVCSVTDAPSVNSCSAGGGSAVALCIWDGTSWNAISTSPGTVTVAARVPEDGDACEISDRWLATDTTPAVWYLPVSCTVGAEVWAATTGFVTPTLEEVKNAGRVIDNALDTATMPEFGDTNASIGWYGAGGNLVTVKRCGPNKTQPCSESFDLSSGTYFRIRDSSNNTVFQVDASGVTQSIWIDAGRMEVSGSCSGPVSEQLIASGPVRPTITCTDNDADSILFDWVFPTQAHWNASTITVALVGYSITNQTTEVVEFDFAGRCVRDGDAVAAYATTGEQAASVTFGAQANDEQISSASSAITLQGTCAAQSHVYMRGQVDATATTYSPMSDFRVLGVIVNYGILY